MSTVLRAVRVTLRHGFEVVRLPQIVSLAAADNHASRAVVRRIGLTLRGGFDHPRLPLGHRSRRHVLCARVAARAEKDQR